jgi:radical SAM protein with 4Fe4S-binding SPASM domain
LKSELYTTDEQVRWYSTEEEINSKLSSIIGKKFEAYREKWESANNFELKTDFPLFLQVETHQICNLRCPSCPIGIPEAYDKYISTERMDWNVYQKIILEGEKYGCPSLEPQGTNEPFLDNNLENYIKFASEHGFIDIMLNTNGTLLSEERSKKFLKSGITRIRFSLDAATKETYEKVRAGAKFDVTMKNIERFLEIKKQGNYELPVVGVNFCKTSYNEHEEEAFIEQWMDKVDFVVIQEFQPPDTDHDYSHFLSATSEYRDNVMKEFKCQQPWQRVQVRSNGEICPCCAFFSTELSLGNIKEKSIYEMWNGEKMNDLRELHKDGRYAENPWCKKCVNGICGIPNDSDLIKIK